MELAPSVLQQPIEAFLDLTLIAPARRVVPLVPLADSLAEWFGAVASHRQPHLAFDAAPLGRAPPVTRPLLFQPHRVSHLGELLVLLARGLGHGGRIAIFPR